MEPVDIQEEQECLVLARRQFFKENYTRMKELLMNVKSERNFSIGESHFNVTKKVFRDGQPSNYIVGMKLQSVWNSFNKAAQLAYYH